MSIAQFWDWGYLEKEVSSDFPPIKIPVMEISSITDFDSRISWDNAIKIANFPLRKSYL